MSLLAVSPYVIADCGLCGRPFGFQPQIVLTVTVFGHVKPICKRCLDTANERRAAHQLPLLKIPPGAYEPEPS